jgi:hypothetical protein
LKPLSLIAASAIVALLMIAPAVSAATTVTVVTNQASYSGTTAVQVSGTVTPPPTSSGQAISFTVTNPAGQTYPLPNTAIVRTTDGSFSISFNTGGPYYTQGGTYTLTANFQGTTGSTTFTYTVSAGGGGITPVQYKDIIGNISALSTQLTALSQAVAALQASVTTLSGTVGTINTNVASIQSTLAGYGSGLAAAGTTQTYVLVVAVLAAITLVLELAILVRKVS